MITLEQIRLLESKITRALELIRVLREENSTLRKGLESAQRRMRELETLVDGFKADQKEIESVILRTLHNLDELEESAATEGGVPSATQRVNPTAAAVGAPAAPRRTEPRAGGPGPMAPASDTADSDTDSPTPKEELDIF
jgi:hypothetical protein